MKKFFFTSFISFASLSFSFSQIIPLTLEPDGGNKKAGVSEGEVSHVSTGGGATLRFLAGDEIFWNAFYQILSQLFDPELFSVTVRTVQTLCLGRGPDYSQRLSGHRRRWT